MLLIGLKGLSTPLKSVSVQCLCSRGINYVQGSLSEANVREYFYFIDHQGMLFLDDARMKNFTSCFKEKKFLAFFFNRIKVNTTDAYQPDFPYVSPCGPEMNYVRCDDRPVVFTGVISGRDVKDVLTYGHAGNLLTVPFEPERLCMFLHTGRVYHPAMERVGGIGLVKSSLAIEFSKLFSFDNGESLPPTHFMWKNTKIKLTNDLFSLVKDENN